MKQHRRGNIRLTSERLPGSIQIRRCFALQFNIYNNSFEPVQEIVEKNKQGPMWESFKLVLQLKVSTDDEKQEGGPRV